MPDPVIVWFRRDLRLADNPALQLAVESGQPVIPLYVLDETPQVRSVGAAGLWWLDKSLRALAAELEARGSRLILRRGEADEVVRKLAKETGAGVVWNRLYDPGLVDRDTRLKSDIEAKSCNGSLLLEPWTVKTKTGGPYKVYTAYWNAAREQVDVGHALPAPSTLKPPANWPASDDLDDWKLHPTAPDWSTGFDWEPGEKGAHARLASFVKHGLADYPRGRDRPGEDGSSRLSPHLHWGELGPRQVWRAVAKAHGKNSDAVETYLGELGWREFNHQLLYHSPDLETANFKPQFDRLEWRDAPKELATWKKGLTGYPIVDAGMRQLWTTGWMHNRVRMIVGSFLVKDLLIDWREGERWFWDTLVDADSANNAGNWQWVAGSGADASPFFRIFNPITQGKRFDPDGDYVRRWVPELKNVAKDHLHAPWETGGAKGYPAPIVDHGEARDRALKAYKRG